MRRRMLGPQADRRLCGGGRLGMAARLEMGKGAKQFEFVAEGITVALLFMQLQRRLREP